MTVYRSKVDIWLAGLVFGVLSYAVYEAFSEKQYDVLWVIVPVTLLVVSLYWQIKYVVGNGQLEIRTLIFGNMKIDISDIKSVHQTYNPLSAPALSINRLEVKYGSKFDYLLISPKNRKAFVKQLIAINPNIDVKL
jgi:hypothetical protein